MTDLTPICALGATTAAEHRSGSLRITENAGLALASLARCRDATQPAPMGLALPGPGGWTEGNGIAAFWTGPDQWMIEAQGRAGQDFAADLAGHAPGCAITEQTDAWVVFEIHSEKGDAPIRALMEKLVNIDKDGFGAGHATRTGLDHMGVFVIRRAKDRLAITGARSSAASLWHTLTKAAVQLKEMGK